MNLVLTVEDANWLLVLIEWHSDHQTHLKVSVGVLDLLGFTVGNNGNDKKDGTLQYIFLVKGQLAYCYLIWNVKLIG